VKLTIDDRAAALDLITSYTGRLSHMSQRMRKNVIDSVFGALPILDSWRLLSPDAPGYAYVINCGIARFIASDSVRVSCLPNSRVIILVYCGQYSWLCVQGLSRMRVSKSTLKFRKIVRQHI